MYLRLVLLLITRIAAWLRLSRREEAWKTAEILTIADQLGHSSVVLTADTYLSVAVELGLKAAAAAARLS